MPRTSLLRCLLRPAGFSRSAALVAALFGTPAGACAQALALAPSGWKTSLLLKGGTLGVGPELDVRFSHSSFGFRADVNGLAFSDSDIASSHFRHAELAYAYDATTRFGGTMQLLNGGFTGDYYPLGTGFRISAGIIGNGNKVTMHGVPVGQLRIGSATYLGAAPGRINAHATFNAVAPLVGLGYSSLLFGRLRISADLGAMYQGNPHLQYEMSGSFTQLPSVDADAE
ncbi:MAG: hypothetical protein ACRYG8_23085, partial [Janthinobacterium lividum]